MSDFNEWEALKDYITQKMEHTKDGANVCNTISIKNQMLTRADTFEEVLSVMQTYEEYKQDEGWLK